MKTNTIPKAPEVVARTMVCKQCGWKWISRLVGRDPLICPHCRSWYWNVDPQFAPKK